MEKTEANIATKCLYALIQEMFDAGILDIEHITKEYRLGIEETKLLNDIINELYSE